MDTVNCQHKELAAGRWRELSLVEQMGNIGSEVSRSLKWYEKGNQKRFEGAFGRALELFDLTIESNLKKPGALKEICRAREEFCDHFFDNCYQSTSEGLMRYYDQFAMLARSRREAKQD